MVSEQMISLRNYAIFDYFDNDIVIILQCHEHEQLQQRISSLLFINHTYPTRSIDNPEAKAI